MKYVGMPMAMWIIFSKSFKRNLTDVLKYDEQESRRITAEAKKKYRAVIEKLPEFEKADRFKMNIVNCAMLSAFFLNMPKLPDVDSATEYYKKSMSDGDDAVVLPYERKEKILRIGYKVNERHS